MMTGAETCRSGYNIINKYIRSFMHLVGFNSFKQQQLLYNITHKPVMQGFLKVIFRIMWNGRKLLRFDLRIRAVGRSQMLHSAAIIRPHPALKERKRPVDHMQK
jgi:hypothetical protein